MSLTFISAQHICSAVDPYQIVWRRSCVGAAWLEGMVAGMWVVTGRRNGQRTPRAPQVLQGLSLEWQRTVNAVCFMHAHNGANIQPIVSEQCPACVIKAECMYVSTYFSRYRNNRDMHCPHTATHIYGYVCMARSCRAIYWTHNITTAFNCCLRPFSATHVTISPLNFWWRRG